MKINKRVKLGISLIICAYIFSACGNFKSLNEMETDTSYVEDVAVYGNSYTNIRNDGAAYIDENGRIVYFSKADTKGITGNISETSANELTHMELYYINVVNDTMYAYMRWVGSGFIGELYGYFGGGIVMYDLTTTPEDMNWYSFDIVREGVILDLQVVDGICYFTDASTKQFYSFNPETKEEKVLIQTPYKEAMVYQNQIYFTGEDGGLYRTSVLGGEEEKISNWKVSNLMPYKDKILYISNIIGIKYLSAIELDGENETFLMQWDAQEVTVYEDRIYFIDKEDKSDIGYIDLTDEELQVSYLGLTDDIIDKLHGFAGEQIYDRVSKYSSFDDDTISPADCAHLSAMNGYLLFDSGYVIANEPYRTMYAYHMETEELILLNDQFEMPMDWESILWLEEEEEKQIQIDSWLEVEVKFQKEKAALVKNKDNLVEYFTVEEIELGQAVIDEIITSDMTEYQRVRAVYDYIKDHVTYDYESYANGTSYAVEDQQPIGALRDGKAVCGGYAHTMELLCVLADVDCIYVSGLSGAEGYRDPQESRHAWNKVKIDDQWYNVDVTWDDGRGYSYFLISDHRFYLDHEVYEPNIYFIPESPEDYFK